MDGYVWLTGVYLVGAAGFDMRYRKIPNWWSLAVFLGGLAACLCLEASLGGAVRYLARIAAVLVLFFPFYMLRVLGAGDVKLMAVISGCLGFFAGIRVIGAGLVVGAVWGLGKMLYQRSIGRRFWILRNYIAQSVQTKRLEPYYQEERDGKEGVIPFAVCLLLGFLGDCIR